MRLSRSLAAAVLLLTLLIPGRAAAVFGSTITNTGTGNCVTVPGGATTAGLQLTQATCAQSFTFTQAGDTYTIGTPTGNCVDVNGGSTADNATIIQWPCNNGNNQRFQLRPVATGTFQLAALHSGKCIAANGTAAGLVQLPCSTAAARVWRVNGVTAPAKTFTNPLKAQGPDPWLTYHNGFYYLATTTWNRTITMRKSATLGGLATATDQVIFTLTRPNGAGTMWAPEFHLINGRWYFYYTAGQEPYNLGTQRIHVLESSGTDPMGPYAFKADLLDPAADNTWELDPSILQLNGKLYLLGTYYNGSQPNFIRELSNPWTAAGSRRVLSTPTYGWETVGGAVNEGAEVLQRNGKTFIVFSASHCSTPDYKLGLLTYNGGDPLNSSSWVKSSTPVFQRNNAAGVYGPGHNGFFKSPDGTEDWIVYHASTNPNGNCDLNRSTRAQKFTWNADGTPNFGSPVGLGVTLTAPSGE
ncbi:family 43 glycosylhydrolase [Paractinoplanes lichenicola]|uniref:Family 43 glycosylhydrolase n=1 Tax=Paractinoplanes lichenicola TaxID=2802976 RepID=A0ABS1W321_9ACTN|nr:family 43 glycosylhydrolase [Actinoplanes lichenicola]MBL7261115.1 family 43 glycosylhydrolase [Actinoplanes lichenicola]